MSRSIDGARPARSLLFVPGDRPERFDKAAASGAHLVVLDLEDAVAPAAKAAARDAVVAWFGAGGRACVRVNGADAPWHAEDVATVVAAGAASVMLPKAEPASLASLAARTAGGRAVPVIALVETVAGVLALDAVASATGVVRLAFGSIDFAAESGIADEGDAMTAVRTRLVLESVGAGLQAPIDGVGVDFTDPVGMEREARRARQLGFGGKLCIHPRQVAPVNAAFRPTPAEVDWAARVLAASAASGGGVTTVDGKMVDRPVVLRAERIAADSASHAP